MSVQLFIKNGTKFNQSELCEELPGSRAAAQWREAEEVRAGARGLVDAAAVVYLNESKRGDPAIHALGTAMAELNNILKGAESSDEEGRRKAVVTVELKAPDIESILSDLLPQAIRDVSSERRRQVEEEGYSHAHDDEHSDGSILQAAAYYVTGGHVRWPWSDRPALSRGRRDIVKAAALVLAELERLDRMQSSAEIPETEAHDAR